MDETTPPPGNQPFVAEAIAIMAPTAVGDAPKIERLGLTVEGEPEIQERVRMSKTGHPSECPHLWDPSGKLKGKFCWAVWHALKADLKFKMFPIFTGVLEITFHFHVSNMRKDVDNMFKFVLDALNTSVYRDDRGVHKIVATKHHSPDHGYTTISVEHLHPVHRIE